MSGPTEIEICPHQYDRILEALWAIAEAKTAPLPDTPTIRDDLDKAFAALGGIDPNAAAPSKQDSITARAAIRRALHALEENTP